MSEDQDSPNIAQVLGQLLMLPLAAFVYGIEMLIKTMQGVQEVSNQGMEIMAGSQARLYSPQETRAVPDSSAEQEPVSRDNAADASRVTNEFISKEEKPLTTNDNCAPGHEKDLRDDMLKLVRYKVLFVRREYETAFPEQEDLVSDNMEGSAFTAWKVAEFIQDLARTPAPGHTRVPQKWVDKSYATEYWTDPENGGYLTGIPHEDKKYLRVYYQVLERYPREKFKYEEQQIRVLEEIRDKIPDQVAPRTSPPPAATTSPSTSPGGGAPTGTPAVPASTSGVGSRPRARR
jgi:hypothetical protein